MRMLSSRTSLTWQYTCAGEMKLSETQGYIQWYADLFERQRRLMFLADQQISNDTSSHNLNVLFDTCQGIVYL